MKDLSYAFCGDGREAAALCESFFSGAVKWYKNRAGLICENTFVFRDHWEMERSPEPVSFKDGIDWNFRPGTDPEWTYALNRHSYLPTLAKAWAITGDEAYPLCISRLLLDWTEHVPLNEETKLTSWRSIEAGTRCENWLRSLALIRNCSSLADEFYAKVNESLRLHADYLREAHTDFQRLSNWGVFQDRGLFLLGVHFSDQSYIDLSLKRLSENIRLQVLPDGIHWEQSPQYHAEVLQCLLTVTQTAWQCEIELPEGFAESVHNMARAFSLWLKPNGRLLCQSDSDDVDARNILVQASILFGDEALRSCAGGKVFEENIWNIRADILNDYMKKEAPPAFEPPSAAFPHSGNYILRSGGNYMHMHCGCLGSGHGHADLLHIDLFAYGEDILIDSGRHTYQDSPIRKELKSPAAHNTITADGKDFTVYSGQWDYSPIAMPVKGEYRFSETADYISGGHLGYINDGLFVFRKIVHIHPGLYIVFDELYGSGSHRYTQYFHWNNRGAVSLDGRTVSYQGKSAKAKLISLAEGEIELVQTPLSRKYNELEKGSCLRVHLNAEGFVCPVSVISAAEASAANDLEAELIPVRLTRTGEVLSDDKAQAVRILLGGESYTVICLHTELIAEVGLIESGGCKGYGKILVFTPDNPDGLCLAW